jgi:hypothetical protein
METDTVCVDWAESMIQGTKNAGQWTKRPKETGKTYEDDESNSFGDDGGTANAEKGSKLGEWQQFNFVLGVRRD